MSSSHGITPENLLRTLPSVLANDENMQAHATMLADALSALTGKASSITIYPRIDDLPEALLDILAKDFKVDWYDYNYSLAAKRRLIKDSFYVHRHLGTRAAVVTALSDVFPNSAVMEWFEYGGEPFFFRVICDITDQSDIANIDNIQRTIELYKSLRSHMEDDAVIIRISCSIVLKTGAGGLQYETRIAGTFPQVATYGDISTEGLRVETGQSGIEYKTPMTGQAVTGTHPEIATQGDAGSSGMAIGVTADAVAYSVRACGTPHNALR